MDWVPGRTWGWLGPSGSLCNELFIFTGLCNFFFFFFFFFSCVTLLLLLLLLAACEPTCVPTGDLLNRVGWWRTRINGGAWFGRQGHHGDGLVQS
jgi:hypothetical protein